MKQSIERHHSAFGEDISNLFGFKKDYLFLDLTLGDGGHTEKALKAGCRVISFDIDDKSIERATRFISGFTPVIVDGQEIASKAPKSFSWIIIKSNFTKVAEVCEKLGLSKFDGIMADLGPSQFQVLSPGRGFSFSSDEPLDMRLDTNLGVTAADLLMALNEGELAELFAVADEPFAKPIARIICRQRVSNPITSTKQLAVLVSGIKRSKWGSIHPATQVFMALRMAVNLERENIRLLLPLLPDLLKKDGLMGIISFHSGEDKSVKDFIAEYEEKNILSAISKKPLEPSNQELTISQRTRSAKLRLAKKII